MAKTANQRRVSVRANTDLVNRLNALDPGLGTLYAADVRRTGSAMNLGFAAASGQRGPMTIVGPRRDATGKQPAAIKVEGPVAIGKGIRGDEAMTRDQIRGLFTCEHFGGHPSGFPGWFEECVQGEQAAAAGGGGLPWFWGWTVQHPHETDTLMAIFSATVESSGAGLDAGQGYFYVTPFPLQESAGFTNVAFWIDTTYTPATTFPGVHDMNVGLYNTDRELVWELGPYEVFSSDGVYGSGAGRVAVDTTATSLESGEYYLAIFLPSCLRLLCVDIDQNMTSLFTTPIEQHMSKYPLDSPFEPNFPEVVPDTPWDEGAELQLIPLFLFTNMDTIGFTG